MADVQCRARTLVDPSGLSVLVNAFCIYKGVNHAGQGKDNSIQAKSVGSGMPDDCGVRHWVWLGIRNRQFKCESDVRFFLLAKIPSSMDFCDWSGDECDFDMWTDAQACWTFFTGEHISCEVTYPRLLTPELRALPKGMPESESG